MRGHEFPRLAVHDEEPPALWPAARWKWTTLLHGPDAGDEVLEFRRVDIFFVDRSHRIDEGLLVGRRDGGASILDDLARSLDARVPPLELLFGGTAPSLLTGYLILDRKSVVYVTSVSGRVDIGVG